MRRRVSSLRRARRRICEGAGMDLDPVLLARLQFAFSISFHILFPAFTIGLAAWIVVLEAAWLAGSERHGELSRFWTRIFA
ncbi:MAG: cytochrome ubiquinol oxidase subunit I, partial [Geminicoccaceae bacterium]